MRLRFRSPRRARKGFTLPEVIVTITLIAVLASVVVPTIVSQVKKGDPSRTGQDFLAIRGAVEQFLADVRKYPGSVAQITAIITTAQNPLTTTSIAPYGAAEIQRWRGPYLTKDGTAALNTGFGLTLNSNFDVDTLAVSGAASTAGGQRYMVVSVPMKVGAAIANDSLSALEIDRQFDDGVLLTGSIRYRTGTTDTLKFLLMPIY
jgi:prepilin-type N-terminal cleavage/methylation domain-containing protein